MILFCEQYWAKKKSIVIDCGHGGHDLGASGCFGLTEKDVNLEIGLKVASLLRQKGYNILITRFSDDYIPLCCRVEFANLCDSCGAFVSIHSNSSSNIDASGIETFCFEDSLLSLKLGAKERERICIRCKRSSLLAHMVQYNVLRVAKENRYEVVDRKVKQATFKVLKDTTMPAALVEVGFLSNEKEAALLDSLNYQIIVAQGICEGIISYFTLVDSWK